MGEEEKGNVSDIIPDKISRVKIGPFKTSNL